MRFTTASQRPKDEHMNAPVSAVRRVINAAGGPVALSKLWNVTYTAINTFERQGYMPLARAKDAAARWPEAAELRDLVRPDIRAAMDLQNGSNLLS
jgi:hypothetical protein